MHMGFLYVPVAIFLPLVVGSGARAAKKNELRARAPGG